MEKCYKRCDCKSKEEKGRTMRAYICMAIMVLACTFSFWLGKTVQEKEMVVEAMENAQIQETIETGPLEIIPENPWESDTEGQTESMESSGESAKSSEESEEITEEIPEEIVPEDPFANLDKSTIVLVNKHNKLPEDYEITLKKLPDRTNQAAEEAYGPMCDMLSAARKDGMILEVCSSYRSVERQKELFEEDMRALVHKGYSYLDAYDEVARETMPPGYSEHATGLAFDIVALSYQMLNEKQERTPENQWLREHCAEFGFILRYPKEKEEITGIAYESWHFRYVGVEIAQYIMENGLTLEEFLAE